MPLDVHYWADLQSVHRFRRYDNIAQTRNVSECLYLLYACFFLVADAVEDIINYQYVNDIICFIINDNKILAALPSSKSG